MKKFIINIFLYLFVCLIFAISLEVVLRHIPNDYSYKKDYLDTHADEIETLILGASQTYSGIDPVYFSGNAFNAAHVSQSHDYDYEILKRYDESLVNLKTVIIPISYPTQWWQLSKSEEDWRIKNYILDYGMTKENDPLQFHFELSSIRFKTNLYRIKLYLQGEGLICSEQGWGTYSRIPNTPKNVEESGKGWALRHTVDIHSIENQKIFADNVAFLDSIIRICQRHNAKVLLLTPPYYKTYCEHANEEQLNAMIRTANEIADKHSNCTYMNLMTDSTFVAIDYADAAHLCETGAKKLSLKLENYIKAQNLYQSGDCGSSPQ